MVSVLKGELKESVNVNMATLMNFMYVVGRYVGRAELCAFFHHDSIAVTCSSLPTISSLPPPPPSSSISPFTMFPLLLLLILSLFESAGVFSSSATLPFTLPFLFMVLKVISESSESSLSESTEDDLWTEVDLGPFVLVLPTGDTEMTELMEGVGDVGLEDAEDEADNGRIWSGVRAFVFTTALGEDSFRLPLSVTREEPESSRMALDDRSPVLLAAEGKTGSSGGSSVWQPRETFLGPTSGLEREPLLRDISSMSRRPLFSVTSLDLISSSLARNPSSIWMDCDITPAISIILSVLSCNNAAFSLLTMKLLSSLVWWRRWFMCCRYLDMMSSIAFWCSSRAARSSLFSCCSARMWRFSC